MLSSIEDSCIFFAAEPAFLLSFCLHAFSCASQFSKSMSCKFQMESPWYTHVCLETALLTFFMVVTASSEMQALWKFRGLFLRRRTVVVWFCHLVTRKLRRHQTRNKVPISPKFAAVKTPNTWDQLTRTSSATSCFFPAYIKLLPGMATGSVSGAYNCPLAMRELKWQADGRLQGLRRYSCTL